ncbi:hypothetical protein BJV77DRAFT_560490 [Russula vinacea]|nr:hypothetical protein BJV77DRAFT_560490 [Russula vinacea]
MGRPNIRTRYAARCNPTVEGPVPKGAASAPVAPMMAKTKSSSSNSGKSRKHRKEARAPAISPSASVPFPSSSPSREQGVVAGTPADVDDGLSGRIPQMSTARARDGGRTQSGGVKGVISLEPGRSRNLSLGQSWSWLSLRLIRMGTIFRALSLVCAPWCNVCVCVFFFSSFPL